MTRTQVIDQAIGEIAKNNKKQEYEVTALEVTNFLAGQIAEQSERLPIKKYEIDFDGNILAGIEISENTPKVFGAMNGHGNGISIENIKITEK